MKKLWYIGLCFLLVLSLVACASSPQQSAAEPSEGVAPSAPSQTGGAQLPAPEETPSDTSQAESHILIAYFSMIDVVPENADASTHATPSNGNTRTAAQEIQVQMGGDLFQIETSQEYPVGHRECSVVAEEEMRSDARPVLTTQVDDMDSYDLVFLGYPIWWYTTPMAVRSFLEAYDFSGKTIVPFCTTMSAGVEQSVDEIRELCPDATVLDGLTLRTGRADRMPENISGWLKELGLL